MKRYLPLFLLLTLGLPQGQAFGQNLRPVEYSWDNPSFRESFIGTYGINSDIEPRLNASDQTFLRDTLLPLVETDPSAASEAVAQRLQETTSPALYFIYGNILLQQGETEEARVNLSRALSLFPSFRRAHRSLALLETREGNFDASIPHWIEVIQLGGGDDQSFGLLGYAYLQNEKWNAAARSFENALIFRPESRDLRRGLVHAFTQTGRPEAARELIEVLLSEDPEDPQLWRLLANLRLEEGNLAKSAAALEVAGRISEPLPDTLMLLGSVYTSLGLPQKALLAYQRILSVPAADLPFEQAFRPIEILLEQRLWEEAIQYAALLRNTYGRDLDSEESNQVNAAIAAASLYANPSPKIAETAEAYAEVFPLDGLLHMAIGEYLARENRTGEALLSLRRAAATEKYRYEANLRLANLLVDEERYNEAILLLRELQKIQYNDRVAGFLARLEELQNSREG